MSWVQEAERAARAQRKPKAEDSGVWPQSGGRLARRRDTIDVPPKTERIYIGYVVERDENWLVDYERAADDVAFLKTTPSVLPEEATIVSSDDTADFLDRLYAPHLSADEDAALDLILDQMHRLVATDRIATCDRLLLSVDVSKLGNAAMLGFLSSTALFKKRLNCRAGFAVRARAELSRRGVSPDRIVRLVDKLL